MIKLILSDMDGTLLPFGAVTVSQRTHEAVLAAQQAGIHFGPASGRDRAALLPAFYGDQRCVSTGIMANGKQVFLNGELILRRSLSQDAMMHLGEALLPFEGSFALANVISEDPFSPTTRLRSFSRSFRAIIPPVKPRMMEKGPVTRRLEKAVRR